MTDVDVKRRLPWRRPRRPAGASAITVVKDPTLLAYRRRYFTQPADGPGRRAFTAGSAERATRRYGPGVLAWPAHRWREAIAREEALRGR